MATVAAAEPLTALPAPFPAVLAVQRVASAQALVAFRGNHYSVPPELARAQITVSHRLGAASIELATSGGIVIARHHLAPAGAGATVRDTGHVLALERAAMAAFTTAAPHRRKQRIPPGPAARAAAAALRARPLRHTTTVHTRHLRPGRGSAPRSWSTSPATPPPPREGTPCDDHTDQHSTTTGTGTGGSEPITAAQASLYQQLRGHLAALKLHTAAEHLPPCSTAPRPRSCR